MKTYSFTDCSLILTNPALGVLTITGKGVGSVAINMSGDRTTMDVAADGGVMPSKIKDRRATATLQLQQQSDIQVSLLKWYNYLEAASTAEWATTRGVFNSPTTGEQIVMDGVAFQKLPDRAYGAQGALQSWSLMIADCQQNTL